MPAAVVADEEDPVIASYDVYFTESPEAHDLLSKLLILQYPSHRRRDQPYDVRHSQKPDILRMKPATGMVEVEVPLLTQVHYNKDAGERFGAALAANRSSGGQGSYGLAHGFGSGHGSTTAMNLNEIPEHGVDQDFVLGMQTLGGKIAFPSERDPIYALGVLRNNELHLSHVDAVVQMRPQLHHVDAEEEINHKKYQSSQTATGKFKAGFEQTPGKIETKAIELKLKDSKEDPKDRNLNENAKLLRGIQREEWKSFNWVDQGDDTASFKLNDRYVLRHETETVTQLTSSITNDDWLEKMSAPREDGKKGLRSKLKGRDRERARRKKVEYQKRVASATTPATVEASYDDSDSTGNSDVETVEPTAGLQQDDVKQEPAGLAAAPHQASSVPDAVPIASSPPKRRGRPRKDQIGGG